MNFISHLNLTVSTLKCIIWPSVENLPLKNNLFFETFVQKNSKNRQKRLILEHVSTVTVAIKPCHRVY